MARPSLVFYYSERRVPGGGGSLTGSFFFFFFFNPNFALLTSLFILLYIYSTSNLFTLRNHHSSTPHFIISPISPFSYSTPTPTPPILHNNASSHSSNTRSFQRGHDQPSQSQRGPPPQFSSKGTQNFNLFCYYASGYAFWMWFCHYQRNSIAYSYSIFIQFSMMAFVHEERNLVYTQSPLFFPYDCVYKTSRDLHYAIVGI